MKNALTTVQLESLTWKISRTTRCIDLAFAFKSKPIAQVCINDAVCSLKEASSWIKSAALSSVQGQTAKLLEAKKCLVDADGFITEALSLVGHHQDQGAVSNLEAGHKAIWEDYKTLNTILS